MDVCSKGTIVLFACNAFLLIINFILMIKMRKVYKAMLTHFENMKSLMG